MASKKDVIVLDNGAYTMKVGRASAEAPSFIPNCTMKVKNERRRAFIGSQIWDCRDTSGLFYILPFQRGYLVRWDVQKTVWDYVFSAESNLGLSDLDCCEVLMTEPLFNFLPTKDGLSEMFFEDYQVPAFSLVPGPDLTALAWLEKTENKCCLVVDVGYSFSHVVPYCEGKRIDAAIRRVDVGGKLLTNYLTEITSYRQLNVMDEAYVMNQVKEDSCFVSLDFKADMASVSRKGNSIVKDYVLPDYCALKRGYLRDHGTRGDPNEQVLVLGNERFSVPELIFSPSDVGLDQMGIAETIVTVVEQLCPEELRPALYKNIFVTGGSAKFPNFLKRLEDDVRMMAMDVYELGVRFGADDPAASHWMGGAAVACTETYDAFRVTKREYEENGGSRLAARAAGDDGEGSMSDTEDSMT